MKIFIIGAGTMGSGIAQSLISSGFDTTLWDIDPKISENSKPNINKALNKMVQKGKLEQEKANEAMQKLSIGKNIADASKCGLVIEAAIEDINIKKSIFADLDSICPQSTIFATNTSSISITEMASSTNRADKVVGMHFFNPVHAMKLVEVIRGAQTSQDTFDKVYQLAKDLGKDPVEVNEAPGFLVNRILIPMINEAIGVLAERVANAKDIDKAMMLGANHPIGPLALADLIGLDVVLAIMSVLMEETGDSKYRPHPSLRKMVRSGKLGRKTGEGFYKY
jgi:3-hydroxybutyryl-CoA dehydrogenase